MGAAWIRTANSSKTYTGNPTVTLYHQPIGNDLRGGGYPAGYPQLDRQLLDQHRVTLTDSQVAGHNSFVLYAKTFPAGTVSLGPNGNGSTNVNMYTVIVQ